MTFDELIDKLLDEGIEIALRKEDGIVWYDLNTGMKSELLIAKSPKRLSDENDEIAITKGRYDHKGSVSSWEGLIYEVKRCLCGRDYMSYLWRDLLVKEGVLKVHTKTTYSYE